MRVLFKVQPVSCSLTVAPSLSASAGEHRGSPLLQPQYLPPAVTPALGGGGGGKGGSSRALTARGAHAFGGRFICASELRAFQEWTDSQLSSGAADPDSDEDPLPPTPLAECWVHPPPFPNIFCKARKDADPS